jgi:hypothetical protein
MNRWGIMAIVSAVAVATTVLGGAAPAGAAPLDRPADPVVLTGADLPTFVNGPRAKIVGFRWTGSAWAQLPIQIDERAVVNFGKIYNDPSAVFYSSQPGLVNELVYTSGPTWTGRDPNGKFDADDELVFMARDSGVAAPGGSKPAGTVADTGVQLAITDPLDPAAEGYVYLFRKAGGSGLSQSAKQKYVKYRWKLLNGSYKKTYQLTGGPNPENSLVTGATYKHHFSDRWASDSLQVTAPGASGVDILDRHKALFAPGFCGRSEDTFNVAEGAFVTKTSGPVRSIRSYVGANSGPSTQRTHIFYDRREDIVTDLRVHSIPSIMDFFDYSPAAVGMTYRNELNPAGVAIDGSADSLTAGVSSWEQVTGPQGTLNQVAQLETSWTIPSVTSYYDDAVSPSTTQCTGDSTAYGASGAWVDSDLPNTDPAIGGSDSLKGTRTIYFEAPGGTAGDAAARRDQVVNPLVTTVSVAP